MTEVQGSTDRATEWMRYIARVLAVIWASWWTGYYAFLIYFEGFSVADLLPIAVVVLISWVIAVVAWRWEIPGGVALFCASFMLPMALFAWNPLLVLWWWVLVVPTPLLGFLASILFFLSSRRKSGTSQPPQNSA